MFLRSILFYVLWFLWTILLGILCLPYLILPKQNLKKPINIWIFGVFKILQVTCGITYEVRGIKNIPDNALIVACKHQSAFETFALYFHFEKAVFIHKKQLYNIPIFGQYLKKTDMIAIDRSKVTSAMRKIMVDAKLKILQGYSIIIFPEGTRKKPGETPDYKKGFYGIYKNLETEILPVAVNSGYYWPKHTFVKRPGKIIISILPKIKSNIEREELVNSIEKNIETETKKIEKL